VDGTQVYPRRGRTVVTSDLAWSKDGPQPGLPRGARLGPPRLVLLAEFDNPTGDSTWDLPAGAALDGARVFWAGPGKLVVGKTIMKPLVRHVVHQGPPSRAASRSEPRAKRSFREDTRALRSSRLHRGHPGPNRRPPARRPELRRASRRWAGSLRGGQRCGSRTSTSACPAPRWRCQAAADLKIRHSQIIGEVAVAVSGGGDVEIHDSFIQGAISFAPPAAPTSTSATAPSAARATIRRRPRSTTAATTLQ
jgi:hypothetical protein